MSGLVGHTLYGVLAAKAAMAHKLPIAPVIARNRASYLAGAYLGCDIQTMPEAVCEDTGKEVGYGTVPLTRSPITGGKVRPWKFGHEGAEFTPRQIHALFYGRSHLVLGWSGADAKLSIPWDHLPDYAALAAEDARVLFGPGERPLAYVLGTLVHVVSDSLIKSVQPGIDLNLMDGKYTPKNRPVQDLVSFHEIGIRELALDWPCLFEDLSQTPIEPVQSHWMRVGDPGGRLGRVFTEGWEPGKAALLRAVLAENRRYLPLHARSVLADMRLERTSAGRECSKAMQDASGGLRYAQMVELAEKAHFRHALWQMTEAILRMFQQVIERSPLLRSLPLEEGPGWADLAKRWAARR